MKNPTSMMVNLEPSSRSNLKSQQDANHGLVAKVQLIETVHGLLSTVDENVFCTILVFLFEFKSSSLQRRIRNARIRLQFSGVGDEGLAPVVLDATPVKQRVAKIYAGDNALEGVARHTGTISGSLIRDVRGDVVDVVEWNVSENDETEAGLPTSVLAAVRLKRQDEERFQLTLNVEVRGDGRFAFPDGLFGRISKEDPVLFDPQLEPDRKLEYDVTELGETDLDTVIERHYRLRSWEEDSVEDASFR